jgi:hypothetical protein
MGVENPRLTDGTEGKPSVAVGTLDGYRVGRVPAGFNPTRSDTYLTDLGIVHPGSQALVCVAQVGPTTDADIIKALKERGQSHDQAEAEKYWKGLGELWTAGNFDAFNRQVAPYIQALHSDGGVAAVQAGENGINQNIPGDGNGTLFIPRPTPRGTPPGSNGYDIINVQKADTKEEGRLGKIVADLEKKFRMQGLNPVAAAAAADKTVATLDQPFYPMRDKSGKITHFLQQVPGTTKYPVEVDGPTQK